METPARDPQLWRLAKARAKFKSHLITYVLVNLLLWAIWAFTDGYSRRHGYNSLPWPVFPTVFWGFGLAIQGLTTYGVLGKTSLMEREYEKLLRRQDKQQA
ncbi:2TM domain-containing protein [Hymenobacter sp. 102]|uniref:2TM domain-containing protein n=1 Tax=Hymenobacter sp. 102 TaxID=3403152 RepID=UPI003CEF64D3